MRPYSNDLRERVATAVDRRDGSLRRSLGASPSASRSSSACFSADVTPTLSSPNPMAGARLLLWDPTSKSDSST